MALIPPEKLLEKTQLRVRLSFDVIEKIKQYCDWAKIRKKDHFIEEAVRYILVHDQEWQDYLQNQGEVMTEEEK